MPVSPAPDARLSPPETTPANAPLDPLMAALLRCPACAERPALAVRAGINAALFCESCGRVYPIEGGVPYLFMDGADSDPGNTESRARF